MTATGNVGTEHRDRAVAQRFEAKYIITELQAMAVRDFIDPYVVPDTYASVYPVTSLYLDSPALMMYRSSEMGEKNRYKLRWRVYDEDPDGPVFFEVKRRMDLVILKRRAALRREHIETVLRGGEVESPDIRAGMAMLLAALAAEGTSRIYNIRQIDRGYERIDERLRSLGADIERVS